MQNKIQVTRVVCEAIHKALDGSMSVAEIEDDISDTLDSFSLDSLDVVEIIMDLEEVLSIEIPDDNLSEVSTIDDLIEVICKELSLDSELEHETE